MRGAGKRTRRVWLLVSWGLGSAEGRQRLFLADVHLQQKSLKIAYAIRLVS